MNIKGLQFWSKTDRAPPKIEQNPGIKPYNNEVPTFKSSIMYIHHSTATRRRLQLYGPHARSSTTIKHNNIGEKELKKR